MNEEILESKKLAYIRVTGPYGEGYIEAAKILQKWAETVGCTYGILVHIYLDDPQVTPAKKCRTDVGLIIPEDVEPSGEVESQCLPGGKYLIERKNIAEQSEYGKAWGEFFGEVFKSGIEMDNKPILEIYHSWDGKKQISDVSFCIAIK